MFIRAGSSLSSSVLRHCMLRAQGFTLIELLIALVILSIALTVGMPAYLAWMQNTRIRSAAESVLNGMQLARAEAVARNTNVAFVFGADSNGWTVFVVNSGDVISARPVGEGAGSISAETTPEGATTITFGSLGTVIDAATAITQVDFDSLTIDPAVSRDLRIVVGAGGGVRLCDPHVSDQDDPRSC